MRNLRANLIWFAALFAGVLAIYLPGLSNPLLFDDAQLGDGGLFELYSDLELRVRMVSYGSFVWLQALVGEGWWKQRLANIAIHSAVAVALWGLYREILSHITPPPPHPSATAETRPEPYEFSPALWVAVGFFALNPAAVYGVAYLIQRSILLATFFVVAGLWLVARGLATGRSSLYVLAVVAYGLALASKEHAILAPLAAIPLYIVIRRPGRKQLAAISVAVVALAAGAGTMMWLARGEVLGKPFDEYSHIYLDQLSRLAPGVAEKAWPLSILNQAWLFFGYGLRWFLPLPELMSINMRPPFPVSFLTFPHLLGAAGYPAVMAGGFFLVIRYHDWRALLGLSVLFPALLFATEFATVWVQDPFVLYRSYLWAIGVPGIVFFFAHGLSLRSTVLAALLLAVALGWWSLDRVLSLATPASAFSDAIEKLPDDPRAVGRWFPYINRGNAYFDRDQLELAAADFEAASRLGDMGMGRLNLGVIQLSAGKPQEALASFDRAEKEGYRLFNLPFQRGMTLLALGRPADAYAQFLAALASNPTSPTRELALLNAGRASLQSGKTAQAVAHLEEFLRGDPKHLEGRYLLAMARLSARDYQAAIGVLDGILAEGPNGSAFYARAVANHGLNRKQAALSDIESAIRIGPDNPVLRDWLTKIRAMP